MGLAAPPCAVCAFEHCAFVSCRLSHVVASSEVVTSHVQITIIDSMAHGMNQAEPHHTQPRLTVWFSCLCRAPWNQRAYLRCCRSRLVPPRRRARHQPRYPLRAALLVQMQAPGICPVHPTPLRFWKDRNTQTHTHVRTHTRHSQRRQFASNIL